MPYDVLMPQLGLTMTEGSVSSWLKRPGELVEKGEMLFTVETDKAEMEVESPAAGYLGVILLEPNKTVPTGTAIAVIVDRPDEIPALIARIEAPGNAAPAPIAKRDDAGITALSSTPESAAPLNIEFPASPRARRLAADLKVDLRHLKPALGRRIVEKDVQRFHAAQPSNLIKPPVLEPDSGSSRVRLVIADRMSKSFQTAPHFYLGAEINATELVKFRQGLRASDRTNFELSYTDLLLKALANTLREQPNVNAYWDDGQVVKRSSIDIAFAVQAEDALLVPVIHNSDRLNLFELAKHRVDLTEKARRGKLTLPELEGGSATLSNLGKFGIDWCHAILNPPQSIILAAGEIAKRPIVVGDRVEACPSLILTVSVDHRVLDGVAGAKFLGRIKEFIEYPPLLLL